MKKVLENVFYNDEGVLKVDGRCIAFLKKTARKSANKRARLCLHADPGESLHEMIIALCRGTYVRPHRHSAKSETFHIIEGHLRLFIFDDKGAVSDSFNMKPRGSGACFLYRAQPGYWHMPLPVSATVVFHEITNGPFTGKDDSVFAGWAPREDGGAEVREYLKRLLLLRP